MTLQGWTAHGVAFVAGAAAGFAMPPWDLLPLAIAGIVVYVWLWDQAPTPLAAFWRCLSWGIGHFTVGSYWILEAFWVPPADFKYLGPPLVLGLAVVLAFFPALAGAVAHGLRRRFPSLGGRWRRLVLLAICWAAAEWLRGHLFTGHPWNPLAHVWSFALPLLQGAALVGVFGLGALTFLVLAVPTAGWRAMFLTVVAVGAAAWMGQQAIEDAPRGEGALVRIVQPNIPQAEKMARGLEQGHLSRLVAMSRREGFEKLSAVIWPEIAIPWLVQPGSPVLPALVPAVPPRGHLLAGAMRAGANIADGVWNSLLAIDPAGSIVGHYDKVHLVPMGEYIPFHKHLAPISGLVGRGSFEEGQGFVTLEVRGLPTFSPVICYEAIFPAAVTGPGARPQWLLNVTNDAWFGPSSGPHQHLASARLRAIEEGLPMLRAANTGISAVIDAHGRVLNSLAIDTGGIIDSPIPPARAATPYSKWGDGTFVVLLTILSLTLFSPIRRKISVEL
jgi:apolipoprotein N-acyltransferase